MNSAAVTSAVTIGGNAAFSYNRQNFMMDSGLRWARYMAGYSFAIDQVAMYREDVDQMSDITIAKMDNIHAVSGLMFVIMIQLIMAARQGFHGPVAGQWFMGMYHTNQGMMCMWLFVAAWLAIHGGARAQAGATYLKTHCVRLPIPTPKQLDKARVYGNHWERQRVWDVFRVPFVAPAPTDRPVDHGADDDGSDSSKGSGGPSVPGKKKRKTAGPVTDFRTPGWVNEEIRELHGGAGGAPVSSGTTPEHFELFRGLQHEWWQHEVYSRIAIFFAFTHWLSAASCMIQSHCFMELRAMWPAFSCTFVLVACHYCINMIDIMRLPRDSSFFNVPMELIVPFPPLITCVCNWIDVSILEEWRDGWVVFIWVCSFICYFIYFFYALRMFDLCQPYKATRERAEQPAQPWWPGEWYLPISFQHALYMVAPPKFLEPGESCLWQEMKAGKGNQSTAAPVKQRTLEKPNMAAWKTCRGANLVEIFSWVFILFGRFYALAWTQSEGDMRFMLKQEGRTVRWPSHMQPWMTPWTRLGTRNEWCHTGGCDRRLGEVQWKSRHEMAETAEHLMPTLQTISDVLQQEQTSTFPEASPEKTMPLNMPVLRPALSWPKGFRPELIVSSHHGPMAALAQGLRSGAMIQALPLSSTDATSQPPLESFAFSSIDHLGKVLGSHWGKNGMMLTMENGHLAECAGMPVNGIWQCQPMGTRLPLGGSSLRKAVVARVPGKSQLLRAAVVFEGDASVTLFESDDDSGVWFPTGEAHLESFMDHAPSFSMSLDANELVLLTEGGGLLKWAFNEQEPKVVALPPKETGASGVVWQTACQLADNRLARLGHRQVDGAEWLPEVYVSHGN